MQYLSAMQQRTLVFKQPIVRDPTSNPALKPTRILRAAYLVR
ncbi:DUF1010 domain-containing protein [Citrobacter freundii]